MARQYSLQYPDAYHHVMNRGNRGEPIFIIDSDCATFWMDWQIGVKPMKLTSTATKF